MRKGIAWSVTALVVVSLATGCIRSRESRRQEAARAAQLERERAPDLDVDINVERHDRRVTTSRDHARHPERARTRANVAAAMIAPEECPMVEGAEVALIDLGDGAALEFVAADPGEVQIVRDRVLNIAVKHQRAMQERRETTEPHAREGERSSRSEAMRQQARMEADIEPMPPSHVAVVDVDRGARIIFVPVDRSDLDRLNETLEERAAYMREGSCPANLMSMQVPDDDLTG